MDCQQVPKGCRWHQRTGYCQRSPQQEESPGKHTISGVKENQQTEQEGDEAKKKPA